MSEYGSTKLFEKWREVILAQPDSVALIDVASGRRWTFTELDRESEAVVLHAPVTFPKGNGPDFVIACLSSWRAGRITCPLEMAQPPPVLRELPERYAHLKLTSATTGVAKCIAFTAEQLAADAANIVSTMGLRKDWPNLACISLSHSYGFSNLVLPLLLHAIPLVLVPAPLPQAILDAARQVPALTIPAVPALWRGWADSKAIPPNLKLAISAGAPLPLDLERTIFTEHNHKVHNFYGSSECGGIAYDRSDSPRSDGAFVGAALDNVSLSLSDVGTLVVRSVAVADTYWPSPQPALGNARFETTDLAELRGSEVYLRGRLSDVINVAGRKVAPEVIEAALKAHPSIRECVVFGRPEEHASRSETIIACLNVDCPVTIPELSQFLSSRLPGWQIPRQWWFTDALRPNERGKFSRSEWRTRYAFAFHSGKTAPL